MEREPGPEDRAEYTTDTLKGNTEICQLLREKKELDEILSSVTDLVWSRRADDHSLVYINAAASSIYGYTPEEMIGTPGILYNSLHPDDREKMQREIAATMINGTGKLDYRVYHRDGTLRYMTATGVVKRDKDGKPVVISGISTDVTELRLKEQDLRQKIAEIENIFESITDSFISLDKNFCFTYVNKEAEKLYNVDRNDVLNKELWTVFPKAKDLKFYNELLRSMNEQVSVSFEEYSPTADIWVSINAYPTETGLAVYFRDVTAERAYTQKIERHNELLNEIARTQSHEVRGPVARIIGLAQLFNESDPSDPANAEIIAGMKLSAHELDVIIRRVVSMTLDIRS